MSAEQKSDADRKSDKGDDVDKAEEARAASHASSQPGAEQTGAPQAQKTAIERRAAPKATPKLKVVMTSYMTGEGFAYSPGDVAEFDEDEAKRIVRIGGGKPFVERSGEPAN